MLPWSLFLGESPAGCLRTWGNHPWLRHVPLRRLAHTEVNGSRQFWYTGVILKVDRDVTSTFCVRLLTCLIRIGESTEHRDIARHLDELFSSELKEFPTIIIFWDVFTVVNDQTANRFRMKFKMKINERGNVGFVESKVTQSRNWNPTEPQGADTEILTSERDVPGFR